MTTVIDASVLVAVLVDSGPEGTWSASRMSEGSLCGPAMILAEAGNALRRMELAGRLSRLSATTAHERLLQLDLELFPYAPYARRVWDLRGNLTSYDAWYVALAEALDCPLLTLDQRLSRAVGPVCDVIVPPTS